VEAVVGRTRRRSTAEGRRRRWTRGRTAEKIAARCSDLYFCTRKYIPETERFEQDSRGARGQVLRIFTSAKV
jgi:hypothetical protein